MNNERWEETVGRIKDTFTVESEYHEPLPDGPGTRDGVIFQTPGGKLKLERVCHPIVTGTHGLQSNRIGSTSSVVKEYSDEVVQAVHAYRWANDAWQEVCADAFDGTA